MSWIRSIREAKQIVLSRTVLVHSHRTCCILLSVINNLSPELRTDHYCFRIPRPVLVQDGYLRPLSSSHGLATAPFAGTRHLNLRLFYITFEAVHTEANRRALLLRVSGADTASHRFSSAAEASACDSIASTAATVFWGSCCSSRGGRI